MKTIALSTLFAATLCTLPALAHTDKDSETGNQCNTQLHGSINYQYGKLTVTTEEGDAVLITPKHELFIKGEKVELSDDEQRWVSDYYTSIETAIPMTVQIATEGLHVASFAVTEVFSEMLGTDNEMVQEFDEFFTDLKAELDTRFYATDGSYQFNSEGLNGNNWIDDTWEDEFESRVENLVEKSMGHMLMAIGRQMLFEDGDMEDFASRMENFGATIEERVGAQTEALEQKADELCTVLAKADYAETRMQKHIPGLNGLDLLEISRDYKMQK
ncbi:DUF2884 family protein [Aestuariibacter sp. GS-14]|uniref:DUF2884 family protein n=1 Tax=Aestuariibacter sp. GS-14 TaxID=2590670 RepID=UPI0015E840F0|nr:DUF2884 family protein [Aestuariibacter sp. GS-14]